MTQALRSLQLAIEMATRARDEADQALQHALRVLQNAQAQMAQLTGYADETDLRWTTANVAALSGEVMMHHRNFMGRLREAIQMQEGVLRNLERQADAARQRRVQREIKLKSFQQLMDKRLRERALQAARREQKQMDEFAGQMHARQVVARRMREENTGESR
ncbi:flagellar export protein FliJ [Hylemonella gracilis str. Niagara R]|uniref:Flagellar FliJ protein n=1 Tax=Hylemonella gracilis str. Niagara R TaxID=1458275 RepID=A0A016XCL1_9BURK|nr:flagellar export protein FliJ [Hylemonella gracilis]EYC49625.1 flagellar export protein FliJ [Hylemonella gracilis str. Niagara R]